MLRVKVLGPNDCDSSLQNVYGPGSSNRPVAHNGPLSTFALLKNSNH